MHALGSALMWLAVLAVLAGGALVAVAPVAGWVVCVGGAGLGGLGHRLRGGTWD